MAKIVSVGELQDMRRTSSSAAEATIEPSDDDGIDVETAPNIPEQLAALEIHVSANPPYIEVLKRLKARAGLLGIPALDDEIAGEARRRCSMLPERATAEDAIAAAEGLPLYADAPDEVIASLGQDDPAGDGPIEPTAEDRADEVTVADHLVGLGVERECTAEMSLHMITERVRDAARERLPLDYAPTDNDVVREAERIWVSLDRKRSHTYSVGDDGSVRDWRRPDMTPDRGDVTTVRTVGDDDGDQADLFAVPDDRAFNGKLYRDAPELANIAERLIGQHGFLAELINCEIRYYWRRRTGVSKGRVKIGYCKRASDLLGHFSGADFIIWLSATTTRDGKFTPTQIEAAIFHQLLHIETDDEGNFIAARHDFEGFAQEIRHYGTWTEDLKSAVPAVEAARQMGLFTAAEQDEEDDEDDEDEDVAGEVIRQLDEDDDVDEGLARQRLGETLPYVEEAPV